MKKLYITLLFICGVAVSLRAQGFAGHVTDSSDRPLAGATVAIADSLYYDMLAADGEGRFRIAECPERVTVRVTYVGYEAWERDVVTSELPDGVLAVRLTRSDTEIDEVVITAGPPQIKKELGKFVMDRVYTSPYAKGTTANTLLRFIPVLNTDKDGITILHKSTPATIRINGRPANMPLNMIPSKNIERIEIIALPGAEYADAKGGIINVILKRGENEGAKVMLTLGDGQSYYNNQNIGASVFYATKKINLMASISGAHTKTRMESDAEHIYGDEGCLWDVSSPLEMEALDLNANFNLEYSPTDKQTWGFRISGSGSDKEQIFDTARCTGVSTRRSRIPWPTPGLGTKARSYRV